MTAKLTPLLLHITPKTDRNQGKQLKVQKRRKKKNTKPTKVCLCQSVCQTQTFIEKKTNKKKTHVKYVQVSKTTAGQIKPYVLTNKNDVDMSRLITIKN